MCFYQNIHAAFHYEHLCFTTAERESHVCEYEIPLHEKGFGQGKECPLHSCCRVLDREVIFRCHAARGREEMCENAFGEDVFVPLVMSSRNKSKGGKCLAYRGNKRTETRKNKGQGILEGTSKVFMNQRSKIVPGKMPAAVMEFWPDDESGRIVVHLEDEFLQDQNEVIEPRGLWDKIAHALWRR
ncbi:hypothetical protein F4776DRAFT_604560 [Hypoxylon sp. NC0597]|nr:hypothetical protein F4776DRAFT_604560 [Hypoxylon sp. NC0597]